MSLCVCECAHVWACCVCMCVHVFVGGRTFLELLLIRCALLCSLGQRFTDQVWLTGQQAAGIRRSPCVCPAFSLLTKLSSPLLALLISSSVLLPPQETCFVSAVSMVLHLCWMTRFLLALISFTFQLLDLSMYFLGLSRIISLSMCEIVNSDY